MSKARPMTEADVKALSPTAMVYRGYATDPDDCKQTGYWYTNDATDATKLPGGRPVNGILEVIARLGGAMQRITSMGLEVSLRYYSSASGQWSSWKSVKFV